jgi:Uma2 family endonuclease
MSIPASIAVTVPAADRPGDVDPQDLPGERRVRRAQPLFGPVYPQLDIDSQPEASDHASATLGPGDDDAMATRIVLTYADLVAMPADGKRYELHEGEIYMTAAPRPRHQQVVGNLYFILTAHVRRLGLGEVFLSPIDVILADVTVVEPDLVFLEAARLARVSDRAIEGPPTLAIEVLSPSTAAADRGVKLQLSAKYGVPHYWLVDPDAGLIETYRLAGPSYEAGPRLDGPTPAALPPFPDLLLDPASVWR